MPTLRLLSVAAGAGSVPLTSLVSAAEPDVVCLHGAPHLLRWRSRTAALARRAGRVVVVAGGRASGSNAVLSTLGVDVVLTRAVRFPDGPRGTPAGAALAVLRSGDARFAVVSATLAGNAADRLRQAGELQAEIGRLVPDDPPVVISALRSDRPGTAAWLALADGRAAVGERVFADERIGVDEVREVGGPAAELTVLSL